MKKLTDGNGASIVVDTTGAMKLIEAALDFTASRGQFILLGVPPVDGSLNTHLITFMQVRNLLSFMDPNIDVPSDRKDSARKYRRRCYTLSSECGLCEIRFPMLIKT